MKSSHNVVIIKGNISEETFQLCNESSIFQLVRDSLTKENPVNFNVDLI